MSKNYSLHFEHAHKGSFLLFYNCTMQNIPPKLCKFVTRENFYLQSQLLAKFELEQLVKQGQRSYEWKLRGASKWHGGASLMRLEHMCLKGSFNSVKTCMIYPAKQNMFHRFTPNCQISRLLYSRLP